MYINPKDKVFWHLEELTELKHLGKTAYPINVEIDLTNRCNLGCSWCHFAYTHTKGPLANTAKPDDFIDVGDVFETSLLLKVLQQLKNLGVKSVTYTGGGEPTLHPDFDLIITETVRLGLDVGLYTNGTHLKEYTASILKKFSTFVYVSLDECNTDDYKMAKGINQFGKAIQGIKNLVATSGDSTVGLGFLLHEKNYNKYPQMLELAKALGVDYCQFRPTIKYDQNNPSVAVESANWINYLPNKLDYETVVFDKLRFTQYQQWQNHGYTTCNWTALETVITPNGKIWKCVNRRGYVDSLIGDLTKESFADIWSKHGKPTTVDNNCRIMCRGHLANQAINQAMKEPSHANFI